MLRLRGGKPIYFWGVGAEGRETQFVGVVNWVPKYVYGPKNLYDVVRISTQHMDTLYTIRWGGEGIQPKINVEKIPPFNEVQVHLRTFSVLQFLERLF